jgi:hypothetical protein
MRRLIIVTDSALINSENRNALTAFLEAKGWSVWHWFQDLWLADHVPVDVDVNLLRDEIFKVLPGVKRIMIMDADKKDHAGMVPTDSLPWLREHWRRR